MFEVRDKVSLRSILKVLQVTPPKIQLVSTERAATGNINNFHPAAGLTLSVCALVVSTAKNTAGMTSRREIFKIVGLEFQYNESCNVMSYNLFFNGFITEN